MKKVIGLLQYAWILIVTAILGALPATAAEDGYGTNHVRNLLTTEDLSIEGGDLTIGKGTTAKQGTIVLHDGQAGSSFTTSLRAYGSLTADFTLTLPPDDGTAGQLLKTDGNGNLSWGDASTSSATRELDNLQNVAINIDLTPATDGSASLGTALKSFNHAFIDGTATLGAATVTGTATLNGNVILGDGAADSITFNGKAANALDMNSQKITTLATPTAATDAATKGYVDGKVTSSVANGVTASDTLRWNGTGWTNEADFTVDASGNVIAAGTLSVTGAVTVSATTQSTTKDTGALIIEGGVGIELNANVGGTLGVTGNSTFTGDATVNGNTILGNANTDTITFNAKAANALDMNSQKITNLATPTAAGEATPKSYVDAAINGLAWKDSVRAASTNDLTLSGEQTVDGIALVAGDRILVKAQTSASQNGIYVVAAGAWTRAEDLDANAEVAAAATFVAEGGVNADSAWVCTTTPGVTFGSYNINFAQFGSAAGYTPGDGLVLTGTQFSVNSTALAGTGLENDGANNLRIAAAAAGSGLTGGGGSALDVNVGTGLEVNSDAVRIAAAAAGNGLTGGAGSALAVGSTANDGIAVNADDIAVNVGAGLELNTDFIRISTTAAGDGLTGGGGAALAVNASVIRTNGAQSIAGVKTFTDPPVVPTPVGNTDAANKGYVDGKLTSSVANGAAANDTLRWNGTGWTNETDFMVDASGNVIAAGTLAVTGTITAAGALTVTGVTTLNNATDSTDKDSGGVIINGGVGIEKNAYLGGSLGVAGSAIIIGNATVTGNVTAIGNATFNGNVTLGDAAGDSITFNGKAATALDMNNQKITTLATPTLPGDATPKSYVDAAINGLSWKDCVRAATTNNITLSGAQTIDGISIVAGDRVLVKTQSTASENGIYVASAAGWTRAEDLDVTAEVGAAATFVTEGGVNANSAWVCTTVNAGAIGSYNITFVQFSSAGGYTPGDGLVLTGTQFSVKSADLAGSGLEEDGANNLRIAAAAAGNGLTGGNGSALAVNVGTDHEISGDAIRLSAAAAGDGLVGGAGVPLAIGSTATDGITVNANDITVNAGAGLELNLDALRIATTAAGDGLTGGGGSALAVNASVIRTNGAQTMAGVKTFVDPPVVPTPVGNTDAANKGYVDGKLTSSVANGAAASETLRWNGTGWTNENDFTVDASGNVIAAGTLTVTGNVASLGTLTLTGAATLNSTTDSSNKDTGALIVNGGVGIELNANVGVNLGVGGNATITGDATVNGNVTLGNAGTDTITANGIFNVSGKTVFTPSSVQTLAISTWTVPAGTYFKVQGSSGGSDLSSDPQIAVGTAGQVIIIQGTSDADWVKLDNGAGLALAGGTSFTLRAGDMIQLIFDGSVWREMFRMDATL